MEHGSRREINSSTYTHTTIAEPRQSLASTSNANTSEPRKISWDDSIGDDDSDDEVIWLDSATIEERLSMLSSSTTCDMSLTDERQMDLQGSGQGQVSSGSAVTFAMESTRVINYDPPGAEHHDDLFYKEWELQRFREIYNLLQSVPKIEEG